MFSLWIIFYSNSISLTNYIFNWHNSRTNFRQSSSSKYGNRKYNPLLRRSDGITPEAMDQAFANPHLNIKGSLLPQSQVEVMLKTESTVDPYHWISSETRFTNRFIALPRLPKLHSRSNRSRARFRYRLQWRHHTSIIDCLSFRRRSMLDGHTSTSLKYKSPGNLKLALFRLPKRFFILRNE